IGETAGQMANNSRETLTQEIQNARQQWDEAVAGLDDQDYLTAEISRGWTLKDVLAHLAAYLDLNARHLRAVKKRKKLASMRARNWYQFNKREAARNKKIALKDARKSFEHSYKDLLNEMAGITDEQLQEKFPSPWARQETRTVRLATVLRG